MRTTVPLRLPDDIIEMIDRVVDGRRGEASRNSVMREALRIGLPALLGAKRRG